MNKIILGLSFLGLIMLSKKNSNLNTIPTLKNVENKSNPLNIRYSKVNNWVGQIGENNGFAVFSNQLYGLRAAIKLIQNYSKKGVNTIPKIVYRWSPPSENQTKQYVKFVLDQTNLPPKHIIKSLPDIINVLSAMSKMEGKPVKQMEFYKAVKLL